MSGGGDVGGVRVGHGLDDDGRAAADLDLADFHANGFVALLSHVASIVTNWRGLVLAVVG